MDKSKFKINTGRFASTSDEEKAKILEQRTAKNTNRSTKTALNCLSEYLQVKKLPDLSDISDHDLPQILEDFYTNWRTKKCEMYNTQSMKSMRSNLARFLKDTCKIDIINDVKFNDANTMFKSMTVQAKIKGKGIRRSTIPIDDLDLKKITTYFNDMDHMNNPDPYKLQ